MARTRRSNGLGTLFKRSVHGAWIARWFDHAGKRRESSTHTTDRAAAERLLAKRIADAALRRDGLIDARLEGYSDAERQPIQDHLADWLATLTAKGVTAKQTALLRSRATALLVATKAQRISDLSPSAVQTAIGDLHSDGIALQTCQHYLRAIKQFSRWLHRDGRARVDNLAHLAGYNASTDRRHERRALDAEELQSLIGAAEHGPIQYELTGPQRALLYRVAAGTGFRASELRSLTPAHFRLDDDPPAIALPAANSKHRRDDLQPIRVDLAALLRDWLANRPVNVTVWDGRWHKHAAKMLRADLRRARAWWIRATHSPQERRQRRNSETLAPVDATGRVVDFHALRATYITLLVRSGASVKVVQELARHSDPRLTLNVYSKLGIHDLSGALDCLPAVSAASKQPPQRCATSSGGR